MGALIQQEPILPAEECEGWVEAVLEARDAWVDAGDGIVHFLGTSCFVAANPKLGGDYESYRRQAAGANRLLQRAFAPLYETLERELSRIFGGPARRHPELGFPGFISWVLGERAPPPYPIHHDAQYRLLPWATLAGQAEPDEVASFTLPLRLPCGGAGLNTWQLYDHAAARASLFHGGLLRAIRGRTCERFEYRLGVATIQRGRVIHQPDPGRAHRPGELRVTLQGHGARFGEGWVLYW